jgi:hypothetical protein
VPFVFHSDTDGILEYSNLNFSNTFPIVNSQTYNAQTVSGSTEYFIVNMTYDPSYFNSISTTFYYNNTPYAPLKIGSGNNLIYNASAIVPAITSQTNISFIWSFSLTDSIGNTYNFNSTSINQTVNTLLISACLMKIL